MERAKGVDLVRRYLENAVVAEQNLESQLRGFASEGDDDDVKAAFGLHADEAGKRHRRLMARLEEIGGSSAAAKPASVTIFGVSPKAGHAEHVAEERIVKNLIDAYAMQAGGSALCQVLSTVAQAAGDKVTADLARTIQAEESRTSQGIWHFIRTRSIIAYNMLTIAEIDPSVETKVGERSWG
jgi:ferritin-like metal-binding protein YciE